MQFSEVKKVMEAVEGFAEKGDNLTCVADALGENRDTVARLFELTGLADTCGNSTPDAGAWRVMGTICMLYFARIDRAMQSALLEIHKKDLKASVAKGAKE